MRLRSKLAHQIVRIALLGLVASIAFQPALSVAADPNAALLQLMKVLRDRGSISEEEYQALKTAAEGEKGTAAAPSTSTNAPAPTVATGSTGAVRSDKLDDQTSSPITPKKKDLKWYEKIGFGGYAQVRYGAVMSETGADLNVPADKTVDDDQSIFLRRGRIKFSGDVSDHLYLYTQMDFAGSIGGDIGVQMRDLYGDIAIDSAKEYRFRLGQSKVPYGHVNLQSSQNRAPMERADAINSAADGERDIGAYFMWAPEEIRARFKSLVKDGLKGSGDYGMFAFGAYAGQGPNTLDKNGEPIAVARLSYPWELSNGQIFETSVHGYTGTFVVNTKAIGTPAATPARPVDGALDQRVGVGAIWYPQPFGIEAEWNIGRGPQLSDNQMQIESAHLHGGYLQAEYRHINELGEWFPFVRWQYYTGGRKFADNAPQSLVNEIDFGIEWSPWDELELVAVYSHTFDRTNVKVAPYNDTTDADRIEFQVQLNY